MVIITGCHPKRRLDGNFIESSVLASNDLGRDFTSREFLPLILNEINCTDSAVLKKKIVLSEAFHSSDTSEILLIPFSSNGQLYISSAYSDVKNRYILIDPEYIEFFAHNSTALDSNSYKPVLELMLLHEIGHFILNKEVAFDKTTSPDKNKMFLSKPPNQPEYLTVDKKIELKVDSIAISLIKQKFKSGKYSCLGVAFEVETLIPDMELQLSTLRTISNFGSQDIDFLRDPNPDHPNLELRIAFMNYFLNPNPLIKEKIDNYLYNRTVAPVHRQEFDPKIFQGSNKNQREVK
jgi:hypothetical protein